MDAETLIKAALREARGLMRGAGSGTREAVDQVLLTQLGAIDVAFTLSSGVAIANGVAAGLGISCLSELLVREAVQCNQPLLMGESPERQAIA